ncbi:MAG: LysR family transcriptional regulator [Propionibacteriales bacterium]|nr:LysR family transcriptional regulator [Propionibacteriales bacterium]
MQGATRWFVILAEEENVTAAADRLRIGQPTLSRMLGRLEHHLGTQLFDRHGRRIALNASGRVFLEHVRRADAELSAAEQAVRDLHTAGPRVVRLGFLHSFGTWLVPDLIRRARERDHRFAFELVQGNTELISGLVLAGKVDLGIVSPQPSETRLTWRRMLHQSVVLAMPAHHRLSAEVSVPIEALRDEQLVSMDPDYGMRQILDRACAEAGFVPHIAVECQELATVAGLIAAGIGIGLIPVETNPNHPPGLVTRPVAGVEMGRDIGLVWPRGRPLATPARSFRDLATTLINSP